MIVFLDALILQIKKITVQEDQRKRTLRVILFLAAILILYKILNNNKPEELQMVQLRGQTMGAVPYSIKYKVVGATDYQYIVDSLLKAFNQSLSTYIPSSEISRFNKTDTLVFETLHFPRVLEKSFEIHKELNGSFDPTIGPLVNAWGFGPDNPYPKMDSAVVDSLLRYVGLDKIQFEEEYAVKKPGVYLDYSAIAKGYAVDLVAEFLTMKGIQNYMIEIGGEIVTKGTNDKDKVWTIGIENPLISGNDQEVMIAVQLEDRAVATSGNYRNYYEKDGQLYAHILDPRTGYNANNSLLSVSVFANDCMTADAYATGFMIMGKDKTIEFINEKTDLDVLLIFRGEDGNIQTYYSEGIKDKVVQDYSNET